MGGSKKFIISPNDELYQSPLEEEEEEEEAHGLLLIARIRRAGRFFINEE